MTFNHHGKTELEYFEGIFQNVDEQCFPLFLQSIDFRAKRMGCTLIEVRLVELQTLTSENTNYLCLAKINLPAKIRYNKSQMQCGLISLKPKIAGRKERGSDIQNHFIDERRPKSTKSM